MLRAVRIFRSCVGILLLTAAGCDPVRDELFVVEVRAKAGENAVGMAGTPALPQAGGGRAEGGMGGAPITVTFGGAGGADPRLDPHAMFSWTETIPGGDDCAHATYTGKFTCKLDGALEEDVLEGALTLELTGSSEARALSVTQGQLLMFDDSMKMLLVAPLTGGLDCNTQALALDVPSTVTEPLSIDLQVLWLTFPVPQPNVAGTLKGALDRRTQVIRGDVTLIFLPGPRCIGTFTVRATP